MLIILLIIAGLLLLWLFMIAPRLRHPDGMKLLCRARYAHRGLHNAEKGVPENSMPAFRNAVERGCGIELDVHLSKDGKLVVEHDDTLSRTCGDPRTIETSLWEELQELRLEGTEERLPLLEEVLALVDGRVPLLVEAKVVKNHAALCAAIAETMGHYHGPYCVESFDPRALLWFRRHAPAVVRGQLAGNVRKTGSKLSPVVNFALYNLLFHVISRPDFVAYHYKDHRNLSLRLCRLLFRPPLFFWTVKDAKAEALSARCKAAPIFEEK